MFRRLFLLSWRLIFWTVGQKKANSEKVSLQKKSISEGIYGRIRPRDNAVNCGIPEIMVGLDVYRK